MATTNSIESKQLTLMNQVINDLESLPLKYEEFYNKIGVHPGFPKENFTRVRYWFMSVLEDTPYTQGIQELAGWNSADDLKKAREAWNPIETKIIKTKKTKKKKSKKTKKKKSKIIVEEIDITDNTHQKKYENYCLNFCKEWIKNTSEPLDDWEWDQDEMELTIICGDNVEKYSAVELEMDEE